MTLAYTYESPEAASADLLSDGFADRGDYFTKTSKVDDWYGGYSRPAIVYVQHCRVDHEFGSDYWELRFA